MYQTPLGRVAELVGQISLDIFRVSHILSSLLIAHRLSMERTMNCVRKVRMGKMLGIRLLLSSLLVSALFTSSAWGTMIGIAASDSSGAGLKNLGAGNSPILIGQIAWDVLPDLTTATTTIGVTGSAIDPIGGFKPGDKLVLLGNSYPQKSGTGEIIVGVPGRRHCCCSLLAEPSWSGEGVLHRGDAAVGM